MKTSIKLIKIVKNNFKLWKSTKCRQQREKHSFFENC